METDADNSIKVLYEDEEIASLSVSRTTTLHDLCKKIAESLGGRIVLPTYEHYVKISIKDKKTDNTLMLGTLEPCVDRDSETINGFSGARYSSIFGQIKTRSQVIEKWLPVDIVECSIPTGTYSHITQMRPSSAVRGVESPLYPVRNAVDSFTRDGRVLFYFINQEKLLLTQLNICGSMKLSIKTLSNDKIDIPGFRGFLGGFAD